MNFASISNLPAIGHEFTFQGDKFTVGYVSGRLVRFTSVAGGREHKVKFEAFLEMMESKDFIHENKDYQDSYVGLSKRDIAKRNSVFKLIRFVESHTDTPCSQTKIKPLLDKYGQKYNVKVMSASNFARTYKRYTEAGYNVNALAPNHKAKGNRKHQFSKQQEKIISKVLKENYFKRNGETLKETYQIFRDEMMDSEEFQHAPASFKRASYASFRRRAMAYDISYRLISRHGPKKAKGMLRAAGIKHETGFPLEFVEADGHVVDCMIVDEETGEVLGRPFLTLFIDRATRTVLSFHLSLRAFCFDTLLVTFKDALRQDNGLPGGRISSVIVDNGSDYKTKAFRSAVLSVGCDLKPCRIQEPNSKPFVESVFRTFNLRCFHTLDGTTFSNPEQRGDYDSANEAIYTLDDLNQIFRSVVDDYHQTIHTQLEQAPLLAWQDWIDDIKGFVNEVTPQEINTQLRDVKHLSINKDTVRFHHLTYKSHDLSGIEQTLKLLKRTTNVHVYIDNSNLSHVYVENPLDPKAPLIKAVSTEPERTKDLTMYDYMREREAIKLKKEEQEQRLKELGAEEKSRANRKLRKRIKDNASLRKQRHSENLKKRKSAAQQTIDVTPAPALIPTAAKKPSNDITGSFENMTWGEGDE